MELLSDITDEALRKVHDPGLRKAIEKARAASISLDDAERGSAGYPQLAAKVTFLPAWADDKRGVPNSALRSALFPAIQGKDRQALQGNLLAVQQGLEIRFSGWQLDQADLDVWQYTLGLARQQPLGTRCHFSAHGLLRTLERSTGKRDHEWLKNVFRRLAGAVVEIKQGPFTYFGTLIEGGVRDERTGSYWLKLNADLSRLFAPGHWTAIDWGQRKRLRGKPLALWLHGFYASHANPYPLNVDYLRYLSGSRTKRLKHFRQNLIQALKDLEAVQFIQWFEIQDDVVRVKIVPGDRQLKLPIANPEDQHELSKTRAARFEGFPQH